MFCVTGVRKEDEKEERVFLAYEKIHGYAWWTTYNKNKVTKDTLEEIKEFALTNIPTSVEKNITDIMIEQITYVPVEKI